METFSRALRKRARFAIDDTRGLGANVCYCADSPLDEEAARGVLYCVATATTLAAADASCQRRSMSAASMHRMLCVRAIVDDVRDMLLRHVGDPARDDVDERDE